MLVGGGNDIMATDFKRGDTGINTAEGQISGPRAARLAKQRQEDQKDYESKRQKIQVCWCCFWSQ